MARRRRIRLLAILCCGLLLLGLAVWAPWLSAEWAGQKAVERFIGSWQGVVDGCGFDCRGCGVKGVERHLLGYRGELEYACGLIPEDTPE